MRPLLPARSRRLLTTLLLVLATAFSVTGTVVPAEASGRSSYIVLTPGDRGGRVVTLQRYLHVRQTGYFGPVTRRAVLRWQANHHRHRTGLVGKKLWRAASGSSRRSAAPASRGGDRVSRLHWGALARCESGGNPRAVNPSGYYGLYQFSPATWRSVGGRGLPSRASAREQTARAQALFRRAGSSPWPVCGRRLF
jgi:peptidoglycan hydrolase-like protein with peptidoglycan-binding domain